MSASLAPTSQPGAKAVTQDDKALPTAAAGDTARDAEDAGTPSFAVQAPM